MAVVGVADQYMILMAVSLLFTILAISYHDKTGLLLKLFAAVSWIVSALAHFAIGDKTSALTISLSLLFLGFAIIFVVIGVHDAASMLADNRRNKYKREW